MYLSDCVFKGCIFKSHKGIIIILSEIREKFCLMALNSAFPQVLLLVFVCIRKKLWDYGRLALVAEAEGCVIVLCKYHGFIQCHEKVFSLP